jgi:predicted ATPase
MFKLIALKVFDHPILGTIKQGLDFVGTGEQEETSAPYTTLILGPNGSGKSFILATVVAIFESLHLQQTTGKRGRRINFNYILSYVIKDDQYEIGYQPKIKIGKKRTTRKNILTIKCNGKEILLSELKLPGKVIALSFMAMDRFRAKPNGADDFYTYLGLRDRSNTVRTNTFLNNSLPMLFEYIQKTRSVVFLKQLLKFLEFNPDYLGLQYDYRYKEHFFTNELTETKFKKLFGDYKSFSQRAAVPYGVQYYKSSIEGNDELIKQLVGYINFRAKADILTSDPKTQLSFNLFDNKDVLQELFLLEHLRRLDLLASAALLFRKGVNLPFAANQSSSGEFHFLTTMIAVQSSIKANSLILIDEPENSLHPNWQMKYVETLKSIFKDRKDSHFVICTHSHFLVGDSEGKTSEIISMTGKTPNVKAEALNADTFGWSPDEILYKVFGLRTTRNYFFELDLTKLAHLLNSNSTDKAELTSIVKKLSNYRFSKEDPLNRLLEAAKNYIAKLP